MAAFIIANIRVDDPARYADYVANVPALIAAHGGRYRVRGGGAIALEGQWTPDRLVVLEFPDRQSALRFYESPEYAPYKVLRQSITQSAVIVIDGCDD